MTTSRALLYLLCAFTGLCGAGLEVMGLFHHQVHSLRSLLICGSIVLASSTAVTAVSTSLRWLKFCALACTLPICYFASSAWYAVAHSVDIEGYILLIALALFVQSVLTWTQLLRKRPNRHRVA